MLAGVLHGRNFLSQGRREIDKREPMIIKEVVLSASIDNLHKVVLGGSRIRHDSVGLSQNQG